MKTKFKLFNWTGLVLMAFTGSLFASPPASSEAAQNVHGLPISGRDQPAIQDVDEVMVRFVQKIHCTAGTLAISRKGQLLYERGYGWLDRQRTIAAPPDAYIGLASCEKPITAAAVRQLAGKGKLDLNAPLFDTLKIQAAGPIVDERVNHITFEHVLEHKAGWGGDIRGKLSELARAAGHSPPYDIPLLLAVARSQPLEDEPGTVSKYSNFGYGALRYVVWYVSHDSPGVYFREKLLHKSTCTDVGEPQALPAELRRNRAVWNLDEGGPVYASARYLCAFMEEYWLTGKSRGPGNPLWVKDGSLPGSTAIMVWRPDGINYAAVFNGRNQTKHEEIRAALDQAIKQNKPTLTDTAAHTPASPVAPSPAERLKQLKSLSEQGLLPKEEYDKKVQEILDKL